MTLFGYGKTTQAIAKRFGGCDIFDDKFDKVQTDEQGNRLMPTHLFDPENSELEITSPGISPSHPLTSSAKNLISDYDLFADKMPFSIWISGTNGKTTTTEMIQWLLEKRGSVAGGNLGMPVADLDENANIWVLETSSFTLHYTKKARPNIYLLLPITPDHVSWHGGMQEYETAKLKPFATMREGEMIIAPLKYSTISTDGFVVGYDTVDDLVAYFSIDIAKIKFKGVFLTDAILALAVSKALFDEIDYERINAFLLDPHKQEEFYDLFGRLWVDDSKATNLDATIEAVRLYENRPIYLILGGDDKGANLADLFAFLQDKKIHVYAIGSNAARLQQLCGSHNLSYTRCDTLDRAVREISPLHTKESVAMLSPAAASLDQFSGYKERGEKFKALVASLS